MSEFQDNLAEDLLSIPPLVHRIVRRKMLKMTANVSEHISQPLFAIMRTLEDEGQLHIAEIGEKLQIPRPQMTHLIDKLVKADLVSRQTDPNDRRVINVVLTSTGKSVLMEFKSTIKSAVKMDLVNLTEGELGDLSTSLRTMRDILAKLQ